MSPRRACPAQECPCARLAREQHQCALRAGVPGTNAHEVVELEASKQHNCARDLCLRHKTHCCQRFLLRHGSRGEQPGAAERDQAGRRAKSSRRPKKGERGGRGEGGRANVPGEGTSIAGPGNESYTRYLARLPGLPAKTAPKQELCREPPPLSLSFPLSGAFSDTPPPKGLPSPQGVRRPKGLSGSRVRPHFLVVPDQLKLQPRPGDGMLPPCRRRLTANFCLLLGRKSDTT